MFSVDQSEMEYFDEIALNDLDGSAELSNMIDKQLQIQEEEDDGIDVGFLEKIIFASQERRYSQLNSRVTKQVVKAFSKTENGKNWR